MKNYILEGCVDSVASAIIASQGGANRLELCGNLMIGGTTPSTALFQEIRKHCKTRIHVLVRPRFGDFCYDDYEFAVIEEEVKLFRQLGAEGIVIGVAKPDGRLDMERMERLVFAAKGMSITLHRVFDILKDPIQGLEDAKNLGIHTILTSGQQKNCLLGKECIAELVDRSKGAIDILVGSGVGSQIIEEMYQATKATSYHMSGKVTLDSRMSYRKEGVPMGLDSISEYEIWQSDEKNFKEAVKVLEGL